VTAWDSPPVGSGGPSLDLRCRQIGDNVIVVSVAGELDLATAPQLRAYLVDNTASRPAHLVLDLRGVTFLASHGIRLMIETRGGSDGMHGELHLTGVTTNPRIRRVLQVTGLLAEFDIHDDEDELLHRLAH
jgi:anti-sigma B factor antagonist